MSEGPLNAAAGAAPRADALAQPLTPEEELGIGDLGNEADDCGLLAAARFGQRQLDLQRIAAAFRRWEARDAGGAME